MTFSNDFTYGLELEWTDCDASTTLPKHCGSWSNKEWTLVNSDGRANDPTLKRNNQGGEINTVSTDTIDEQVEITQELQELLNPTAVYRANLHVHIGVKGLQYDIKGLHDLFQYVQDNQEYLYHRILPRTAPVRSEYPDPDDWKIVKAFNRQQNLWAKQGVPLSRVPGILAAKTPQEFYDRHFYYNDRLEKYVYHIGIHRAGINVRSLFNHDTIEFRCFPGTTEPEEVRSCLEFADAFVRAGLSDHSMTAEKIFKSREWKFPEWKPFSLELEKGFQNSKKRPDNI
jgi:hypothetical protein